MSSLKQNRSTDKQLFQLINNVLSAVHWHEHMPSALAKHWSVALSMTLCLNSAKNSYFKFLQGSVATLLRWSWKILPYFVANLSKTLHINFYQNRSSIVEVMIKNFGVFFMPHSVLPVLRGWFDSNVHVTGFATTSIVYATSFVKKDSI